MSQTILPSIDTILNIGEVDYSFPKGVIYKLGANQYVHVVYFLQHFDSFVAEIDDVLCTPFYIQNGKRYEIYQYEIEICDDFYNAKTFFEKKLKNCSDAENIKKVISENNFQGYLKGWMLFLLSCELIKIEVQNAMHEFDPTCLFIEFT